jgi:hypothetical protein
MSRYNDVENDRQYCKCADCGQTVEAGCGCDCDDEREKETDEDDPTEKQVEDSLLENGTPSERWLVVEVRSLRAKLEEAHKLRDDLIRRLAANDGDQRRGQAATDARIGKQP